jgi:predicted small secreted protein
MKTMKKLGAVLATGALLMVFAGCQKTEGPAERAGKDIDHAVDKAGQKIEQAGEKIQDTAKGITKDDEKK